MNLFKGTLVALVLLGGFVVPQVAHAVDWWPLVPCGLNPPPSGQPRPLDDSYYQPCTECSLLKLVKNLVDFIYKAVTPILATLFITIAGFKIVTAGAFPAQLAEGKKMFTQTLIGILMLSLAWLLTNTLLTSFAKQEFLGESGKWWEFNLVCTPPPTISPTVTPTGPVSCEQSAWPSLAQRYNVPFPYKNSPALDALIACVRSEPLINSILDTNQIYTNENSNKACNYTRGEEICGNCAHSVRSCHYGGAAGTQGSEGVDFNARGVSEQELYNRLRNLSARCNFGYIQFEGDHTHVSTKSCDGN